ncbi:Uncharacterised protein [Mycobacteroides abscessus subsp. abscessus]|nr:Uncharacterised protein [Mycobacteroides abscessus subsp. abscessus]
MGTCQYNTPSPAAICSLSSSSLSRAANSASTTGSLQNITYECTPSISGSQGNAAMIRAMVSRSYTSTHASYPKRSPSTCCRRSFTVAAGSSASNSTLPLARTVVTPANPAASRASRTSAIFIVMPPTFTPRSSAAYLVMISPR